MRPLRTPRVLASALAIAALLLAVQRPATAAVSTGHGAGAPVVAAATQVLPVTLKEMSISVGTSTVLAGSVTFTVTNRGTVTHEVVLLRTDRREEQIPPDEDSAKKASESASIGEIDDIDAGTTKSATFDLVAGHYILICNEPGHYAAGMRATLLVATPVSVNLQEMKIALDRTEVPAGPVLFSVKNGGTVEHELIVLRTDDPVDQIPADVNEPGKMSEDDSLGEVSDLDAGRVGSLLLRLQPGNYVLICNEAGHYAAGMRIAFTVIPPLPQPTYVQVTLSEMKITLDRSDAFAGTVRFVVTNGGTVTHEFVILKTDLADGKIPVRLKDPSKVDEIGDIGEAEDIDPGQTKGLELTLDPGHYVLICNEAGHYAAGMHLSFTVEPQPTDGEPTDEGGDFE